MPAAAYRKRPVVVSAMRWDGTSESATEVIDWVLAAGGTARYVCSDPDRCAATGGDCPHHLAVSTLEGTMRADLGDWIVRGVAGEHYPVKPDIFTATYEPASDDHGGDDGQR